MKNKINVDKLSDENIQDIVWEIFENKVARFNNIQEFETKCVRENGDLKVEITVVGLAGSPTPETFKKGGIKEASQLVLENCGETLTLKLVPEETHVLNSNDYVIIYKAQ